MDRMMAADNNRKLPEEQAELDGAALSSSVSGISSDNLRKWQRIANLVASVLEIPTVMLVRFDSGEMLVDVASQSEGNPIPAGSRFAIDGTHFCEVVDETRSTVVIDDATRESRWAMSAALRMGFVSYLGVPLLNHDGSFFGTICCFAPRVGRFGEKERRLLEGFREVIQWDLILASDDHVGAVRALRDRPERLQLQLYNRALVKLAAVPSITGGELHTFERTATEIAAETLGVERVSVWLYENDHLSMRCIDLFEKSFGCHTNGVVLSEHDYPGYFRALAEEKVIDANDAVMDERTREFAVGHLVPRGIVSMLGAPIRSGGRMVGVLCHEQTGTPRTWTVDEQVFVGALADLIAIALEDQQRRRTEDELREALRQNREYAHGLSTANEELRGANERLLELDRLKSAFLAAVSHELRTPLATIQGAVENLLTGMTGRITEMQLRMLEIVSRNAGRLNRLIENLLEYSRMSSGRFSIAESVIDIRQPIRQAIENIRPVADRAGLRLTGSLPEAAITTSADPDRIIQIATNLLDNAVRFARSEVKVSMERRNGEIEIAVVDDGVGIASERLAGIFQQVARGEIRPSGTHLGLGLSIVKAIAEAHGGSIAVESPLSATGGTRVAVVIPSRAPDSVSSS